LQVTFQNTCPRSKRQDLALDKGVAVLQIAEGSYKWKEFRLDTS